MLFHRAIICFILNLYENMMFNEIRWIKKSYKENLII